MFELISSSDCEQVQSFYDRKSGIRSIIAIHSTSLGPAIGGCRMLPYPSETAALDDVIRLAKNMTYKSAMAGVNYGGGKSIILLPDSPINRNNYFKAFGSFVNQLAGRYITAIDSGTSMKDMQIVSEYTNFVTGYHNQTKEILDPSYYTAKGVMHGLLAAAKYRYSSTDLTGKKILIKGIGNVGKNLAKMLHERGANLYFSDIDSEKLLTTSSEIKSSCIDLDNIFEIKYDIICPCDTSFTITERNIKQVNTDIIVGATNNQLESDMLAEELQQKGIIYCPDYVVNSGGLIYVAKLYEKTTVHNINESIQNLYNTTLEIINNAQSEGISTKMAADQLAQARLIKHQELIHAS